MLVSQVSHYQDSSKRLIIAGKLVEGAAFNMLKNLRYYERRERDLETNIGSIQHYAAQVNNALTIEELMGLEGNIRQVHTNTC